MQRIINPFGSYSGSERVLTSGSGLFLLVLVGLSAWFVSTLGLAVSVILVVLPFFLIYSFLLFKNPIIGLYSALILGFLLIGIDRYVRHFPTGLVMDGILIFTLTALVFNRFNAKWDGALLKKDITILSLIWFGYSILELFNPEARSFVASLSGIRGVSGYMILVVLLTLILIDNQRKLNTILYICGTMSILVSIKGILQNYLGVDMWEKAWLDQGGGVTHLIFGKLRVFSFLSDAGQFGANQAYLALIATIIFFVEKGWQKKTFFLIVALLGFFGMLLSGTRGAMSIPFAGFFLFFILVKNWKIMIAGFVLILLLFVFFKFTYIGQGNQHIRRMRTAFNLNDASLQVRIENQKTLSNYLASRPFGGGIGHAGVKAQRYLPNAFLSKIPTDSWYVMIWAEQGIVGLLLHLFILFFILIRASWSILFRIRDPVLKIKMAALTSGMFGVMVASYGNAVLGTMPTSILIYASMALILNSEKLDTPAPEKPVPAETKKYRFL